MTLALILLLILKVFGCVLFSWGYMTLVHEVSHMVVGHMTDPSHRYVSLRPFWHWVPEGSFTEYRVWRPWEGFKNPYDVPSHFFFGLYVYTEFVNPRRYKPIYLAPLLTGAVHILLALTFLAFVSNTAILAWAILMAALVDYCVWWIGVFRDNPATDSYLFFRGSA